MYFIQQQNSLFQNKFGIIYLYAYIYATANLLFQNKFGIFPKQIWNNRSRDFTCMYFYATTKYFPKTNLETFQNKFGIIDLKLEYLCQLSELLRILSDTLGTNSRTSSPHFVTC